MESRQQSSPVPDLPSDSDAESALSPPDGISHIHAGVIIHLISLIVGTTLLFYGFGILTTSPHPVIQWLAYLFYAITMTRAVLQFVQKRRDWDTRMRMSRDEIFEGEDLELGLLDDDGDDEDVERSDVEFGDEIDEF